MPTAPERKDGLVLDCGLLLFIVLPTSVTGVGQYVPYGDAVDAHIGCLRQLSEFAAPEAALFVSMFLY